MSSQLKPGGLALIVGCVNDPVDIGKSVELVELLAPWQVSVWVNPATGRPIQSGCKTDVWLVFADSVFSSTGYQGHTLCAPHHLRPLRGDRDPVRQDELEMVV